MIGSVDDRYSADRSRAGQIAKLIADDFYGDGLNRASRAIVTGAAGATQGTRSVRCESRMHGQSWLSMLEVEAVQHLRSLDGNYRTVRLFLTFISAMERGRDSTQLWKAGMRLYRNHPKTFDPQHVAGLEIDTLGKLLEEEGVSRWHRDDTKGWYQIAKSLSSGLESPVTRVIDAGLGDAQCLVLDLKKSLDNSGHARFPLLRGPKVGPMWIRIMVNPGRARIDRIETVPVAVDVHVRRATENLGVASTRGLTPTRAKPVIQQAWMNAVSKAEIAGPRGISGTCAALDPALWSFGKNGCGHCKKADKKVRFGRACDFCVRFG